MEKHTPQLLHCDSTPDWPLPDAQSARRNFAMILQDRLKSVYKGLNQLTLSRIRAVSSNAAGLLHAGQFVAGRRWRAACALFLLACCAGCAPLEEAAGRWAGWFAYVEGTDLKPRCADGQTRWRLVYNGNYRLQIRAYDIVVAPDGAVRLAVMVRERPSLIRANFDEPLAAYRGELAAEPLPAATGRALLQAIGEDVAPAAPAGLRLASDDIFWLVMGCSGGRFRYDAISRDSPRWHGLGFPPLLLAADPTGLPITEPDQPCYGITASPAQPGCEGRLFTLTVEANGLAPMPHLR